MPGTITFGPAAAAIARRWTATCRPATACRASWRPLAQLARLSAPAAGPRGFCSLSVTPAEVVGSHDEGILVTAQPYTSGEGERPARLDRGSVVSHSGRRFVCAFRVSQYWFAAPASAGDEVDDDDDDAPASGPSVRWLGSGAYHDRTSDKFAEAAIACLRRSTPVQNQRAQLSEGFLTGVTAVDALAPIGLGQSLLVCGPRGTGKSTFAREALEQALTSRKLDTVIRFGTESSLPLVAAQVQRAGALRELFAVPSPAASSGSMAPLLVPMFAAVGAAEDVRDEGGHALLVLDTMAPLLDAWTLAVKMAGEASGAPLDKEGMESQRRACFAGLLERAANLAKGGSLTLVLLTETSAMAGIAEAMTARAVKRSTQAKVVYSLADFGKRKESEMKRLEALVKRNIELTDVSLSMVGIEPPSGGNAAAASPEASGELAEHSTMRELQSLSDGQIVLDPKAAEAGDFPAIVTGATFSRFGLGSSGTEDQPGLEQVKEQRERRDVRPPALQAIAAHLRTLLALEGDAKFRPPTDKESRVTDALQTQRLKAVRSAMLQLPRTPLQAEEMAALLLAAYSGALDELPEEEAAAALRGGSSAPLLKHLRETSPQVIKQLALEKTKMSEAAAQSFARQLQVAVKLFVALQQAGQGEVAAVGHPPKGQMMDSVLGPEKNVQSL